MKNLLSSFALSLLLAVGASASVITYSTLLNSAGETQPDTSTGTGLADVTYNSTLHTLAVYVTFSGLSAATTASHIHCCTATPDTGSAGVATTTPTFPGFPLGVTSGTYSVVLDLTQNSSWNAAFITANGGTDAGAEAALAAGLASGESYLNIHSTLYPSGEIRGYLAPAPEPSTALLVVPVLAALGLIRKRSVR